jgi:hypothetical protein
MQTKRKVLQVREKKEKKNDKRMVRYRKKAMDQEREKGAHLFAIAAS